MMTVKIFKDLILHGKVNFDYFNALLFRKYMRFWILVFQMDDAKFSQVYTHYEAELKTIY